MNRTILEPASMQVQDKMVLGERVLDTDRRPSGTAAEGVGEATVGQERAVEAPKTQSLQQQEQLFSQSQRMETTEGALTTRVPVPQRPGSTPDSCAIPFEPSKQPHNAEWYYRTEHKTAPTCAYPLLAEEIIIGVSICKV